MSAADSSEAVIVVEGLSKNFGELRAVDDLNLAVAPGESFALVGPDGAGKTTAIRLLCGIMDPERGQARVLGYDTVSQLGEHQGTHRLHAAALRALR